MLTKEQKELYEYIDELSDDAYYQHPDECWSNELWIALQSNVDTIFGHLEFNTEKRDRLNSFVEKCGGWIRFDENNDEYFVTLDELNVYLKSESEPVFVKGFDTNTNPHVLSADANYDPRTHVEVILDTCSICDLKGKVIERANYVSPDRVHIVFTDGSFCIFSTGKSKEPYILQRTDR